MELINTMREAKRLGAHYRVFGQQGKFYIAERGNKVTRSLLIDKPTAVDLASTSELNQFAYACKTTLDDAYVSNSPMLKVSRGDRQQGHRVSR